MAIIGYNGSYSGSTAGKFWLATKFSSPASGSILSINVYLALGNYTGRQIAVGIYNDNGGVVGTLIANSSNIDITPNFSGWLNISIPATEIIQDSIYWLVVQANDSGFTFYTATGTTNQRAYKSSYTFPYWTSPPTGLTYTNYKLLIYAEIVTIIVPVTKVATDINIDSATLNGTLIGLEEEQSADVWFEYWKQSEPGTVYETDKETLSANGDFDANISGLIIGTDYEFRAKAQLKITGEPIETGDTLLFTTTTCAIRNISAEQLLIGDNKRKIKIIFEAISVNSSITVNSIQFDKGLGEGWENITEYTPHLFDFATGELGTWISCEMIWDAGVDLGVGNFEVDIKLNVSD